MRDTTLGDFLLARIAEEEGERWHIDDCRITNGEGWCTCNGEARAETQAEAKRRIVGLWDLRLSDSGAPLGGEAAEVYYDAIKALALPYADHADYRQEWRS